jgi:hypothetical protein
MTGGLVSLLYWTVWEAVPVLPQASVTVQFLVVEKLHPEPVSVPTVPLATRSLLQLSVTLAVPKAAAICAAVGLQASGPAAVSVMTGGLVSLLYWTVWEAVPVLPQASVTVQFLVVEKLQPEPVSVPTVPKAVRPLLQLSVTLAVPNAAAICAALGLQPSAEAGVNVITGD